MEGEKFSSGWRDIIKVNCASHASVATSVFKLTKGNCKDMARSKCKVLVGR